MTEPFELTATAALSEMRAGALSPTELMASCQARTSQTNPTLNAIITRVDEQAATQAAAATEALAAGDNLGPLGGLPIAIKDLQPTAGIVTTYGSERFRDHVPDEDAPIVAKVRDAGAIIVGKTNIPEFSIGANTVNPLFGATGNPFDPALTCGGSSGGSAVALAANMVPLATGSDHGGSLRIPASFCGVVGHRATPGVVPNEQRTMTQTFYSVQGPMARTVSDTALLLSVVAGRTSRLDPMAFPLDTSAFASLSSIELSDVKIGFSEDLGGLLVSQTIRETFRERIALLAPLVGRCETIAADLTPASEIDWRLRSDVFAAQYHRDAAGWDDDFNPNVQASFRAALETPLLEVAKARRDQMDLYQRFQAHFDDVDVVICPGVSVSPFPWSELYPTEIDGQPVDNYMAWLALTASLTVVGHPVTALPCGVDAMGLPFGLQIVGPTYSDHRLLSIAAALEEVFTQDARLARPQTPLFPNTFPPPA